MNRPDVLYLSPHLDDAVLSCGGTIHRQVKSGRRVAVLTVFTADLQDDPSNRLLRQVYGRMKLRPTEAMASRREEDLEACRKLGAEPAHWGFDEALGRHADLPRLKALFEAAPASDEPVAEALAARFRELEDAPWVASPLGLGGHMDHRIVRHAAESVFGNNLLYYEDFPYVLSLDAVEGRTEVAGLAPEIQHLDRADVDARVEAIEAYESQVGSLFGSPLRRRLVPGQSIGAKVRRHVRAVGGERFWSAG